MGGGARLDTEVDVYQNIKTDGVYRCYYIKEDNIERNFLLQLECKLDIDFNDNKARANVLLQVCCYLKQIHEEVAGYFGDWDISELPVVVVLGSKINCMTLPSKYLLPYAQGHISGYKSASTAYQKSDNKHTLINIENDSNIQAYSIVYSTEDKDCILNICDSILKIGQGLSITDDLTENNISKAFDFFDMYVLDKKQANKLTSRQKVDMFIGTFYSEDFREDKSDRWATYDDIIRLHGVEIKVDPIKYNNFKLIFNMRQYSRLEQKKITAITDRLIEDTDRRRKGDFYTPSIWVDEAHNLLSKNLGNNWKEEYMVWDCAWGTGNLTRDYIFEDLYCSTLHKEDLNIGARYNKNACKFQYDFLNDDVEEFEEIEDMIKSALSMRKTNYELANNIFNSAMEKIKDTKLYKCAPGLLDGLMGWNGKEKKKLLFFINPPYGTGSDMKSITQGILGKSGIGFTAIYDNMELNKIKGRRNIYTQFLYRIYRICNLLGSSTAVGVFTPSSLLNNDMNSDIRKLYKDNKMNLTDSFMIRASNFSDVADNWAIIFSLWGNNKTNDITTVLDIGYTPEVQVIKKHILKQISKDNRALDWIRSDKRYKKVQSLVQTSAINVHEKYRSVDEDSLCQIMCNMNIVESNLLKVTLIQNPTNANWAIIGVHKENFNKVVSYFCARKLVQPSWINCKDEYMVPNITDCRYSQWNNDCIIYSLFNTASNFVSMRKLQFEKIWNIQNEFFWMSVKDIERLAGGEFSKDDINIQVENDIEDFGKERFVYKKMQEVTLSSDAQAVLNKATELVKSSFKYRKEFNEKHPEYHINTWDAGWYQIKGLLKEYDPNGLKEFNALYKAMEDRMRPLVYELGFLYK